LPESVVHVAARREPQATAAPQLVAQTLAAPCTANCCAAVPRSTPRKLPTFYVMLNEGKQIKNEGLQLESLIFTSGT